MSGTRWAVLCADGREFDCDSTDRQAIENVARAFDRLSKCCAGPHRVVERLTDPEPWILALIASAEASNFCDDTACDHSDCAALRAVPEVWREAAREAQT